MSFLTKITLLVFVATCCWQVQAFAQHITTFYSPNAYSVQRVTFAQPVVVQQPFVAAPSTVVVNRPVLRPFAPTVITTFHPVTVAPAPVAVTQFAPVPITTTRHRPILGGTVQRTRVGYAPVTTFHGW